MFVFTTYTKNVTLKMLVSTAYTKKNKQTKKYISK